MNTYRMILTRGNPIVALQKFLRAVWQQSNLDFMLVPITNRLDKLIRQQVIDDPSRLEDVNPFTPLMVENTARKIPDLLNQFPRAKIGIILRPCELRALNEVILHRSIQADRLLTICIDCLKTISVDDYHWRVKRQVTSNGLTQQVLQFARQGGIATYRYRSACQMCSSPEAKGADINIAVLGLPVREQLIIQIPDEKNASRLNVEVITDGIARPELITQHQKVLAKIHERNAHTMHQITKSLEDALPKDIDTLITQLEICAQSESWKDICPIWSVCPPQKTSEGHYSRDDLIRWLISCSGCGMCEQAGLSQLPLGAIFRHIREGLI